MSDPISPKDPLTSLLLTDPEAKRFFDSLPLVTQETIRQTGVSFENCQDLKQCAEKFMGGD